MKKHSKHQRHRKISEMLTVLGDGFIQMGTTLEERENYLRTVATSWNIASLNEDKHEKCIADSISWFIQMNSGDKMHAEAYGRDLRKLIERKLKLFPFEKAQVLEVRIVRDNGQETILAVSQRM